MSRFNFKMKQRDMMSVLVLLSVVTILSALLLSQRLISQQPITYDPATYDQIIKTEQHASSYYHVVYVRDERDNSMTTTNTFDGLKIKETLLEISETMIAENIQKIIAPYLEFDE